MSPLTQLDGVGTASIFKGDPRHKETEIDAWYQEILSERSDARARPYLYGSDAGLCARRNVLLEHNTWLPSEKSPATQAYMAIGVGLEDMLAQSLQRNQRLIVQGQRLIEMPEVKISGKIDLIVFDHQDELSLIEVKTCGKLPETPNPVHLAQIQTYAAVSGITKCWLTYISRNVREEFGRELALRSFAVDTSKEVLKHRLHTALLSRHASDYHKLPQVPPSFRKHTECHYCEFRDVFCWGERPGLGGNPPMDPMHEYTPAEQVVLDNFISKDAEELVNNIIIRKMSTIQDLLKIFILYDDSNMIIRDKLLREEDKLLEELTK